LREDLTRARIVSIGSGICEDDIDRGDEQLPILAARLGRTPTGRRQPIILAFTAVLGHAPLGTQQATLLERVQRGIERAFKRAMLPLRSSRSMAQYSS